MNEIIETQHHVGSASAPGVVATLNADQGWRANARSTILQLGTMAAKYFARDLWSGPRVVGKGLTNDMLKAKLLFAAKWFKFGLKLYAAYAAFQITTGLITGFFFGTECSPFQTVKDTAVSCLMESYNTSELQVMIHIQGDGHGYSDVLRMPVAIVQTEFSFLGQVKRIFTEGSPVSRFYRYFHLRSVKRLAAHELGLRRKKAERNTLLSSRAMDGNLVMNCLRVHFQIHNLDAEFINISPRLTGLDGPMTSYQFEQMSKRVVATASPAFSALQRVQLDGCINSICGEHVLFPRCLPGSVTGF